MWRLYTLVLPSNTLVCILAYCMAFVVQTPLKGLGKHSMQTAVERCIFSFLFCRQIRICCCCTYSFERNKGNKDWRLLSVEALKYLLKMCTKSLILIFFSLEIKAGTKKPFLQLTYHQYSARKSVVYLSVTGPLLLSIYVHFTENQVKMEVLYYRNF